MYLKRLEIQGFKSFANKTALDFLPPHAGLYSVIGIVGPNGAGKSNITDALRWVMGETSLKNLRGKKSEDVIFGGSATKGALGASVVTMVLENGDASGGARPLDLGGEFAFPDSAEISISRRLYRSGESEYQINTTPVRLLDIHLLLAKLQFAQHAYSIISQGMIDRLLTVSPAERKEWFDEACGIKEFQIKEHQAALKLARTRENMAQAEGLLQEVAPRLRLLSRQVKRLEQRQAVESELRSTQEEYYGQLAQAQMAQLNAARAALAATADRHRAASQTLLATQTELAILARGESRGAVFAALEERYQKALREQAELERAEAVASGKLQVEYGARGAHNLGWLEGKIASVKQQVAGAGAARAQAERMAENAGSAAAAARATVNALEEQIAGQKLTISQLQTALIEGKSEQSFRDYAGLTAVQAVLAVRAQFGGTIYGVVAELGQVEEPYALALEVAAGVHLSSLVVETPEVAERAIAHLRRARLGIATFLPLSVIQAPPRPVQLEEFRHLPGVVGWARELVSVEARFSEVFNFVFGNTLVVENLAVARRIGIGRCRLVTLEGDLIERRGAIRGGYRLRRAGLTFTCRLPLEGAPRAAEPSATLLSAATAQLAGFEEKHRAAITQLQTASVEHETARERLAILTREETGKQTELAELTGEWEMLTASPGEYGEYLDRLRIEHAAVIKRLASQGETLKTVENEMREFNAREEEKKQRVFARQEQLRKQQEAVTAIVAEQNAIQIEIAKLETKHEDLGHELFAELHVTVTSLLARGSGRSARPLAALEEQIQKLKYTFTLIGGIDTEVVAEHRTTKERHDFLVTQLADLRAATADLAELITDLTELMKKRRAAAFKQIRQEFGRYFQILFGGGSAALEEVYGEAPDESEENLQAGTSSERGAAEATEMPPGRAVKKDKILTGIEVIASPPGKKIKHLNALSGGERTLTAIALICAILSTNPAPFVVLDEVEAALDEANTLRFTRILKELATRSQFIIVTHNRVTMHAADALYGVVMGGDGVSKLLSVKVEEVPQ